MWQALLEFAKEEVKKRHIHTGLHQCANTDGKDRTALVTCVLGSSVLILPSSEWKGSVCSISKLVGRFWV